MKVIISGSRNITDHDVLEQAIKASGFDITQVIEGGCRGVDRLARMWAERNRIPCVTYRADWVHYGAKAGPIRNSEMADAGEALIAIPAWPSPGTRDMIRRATNKCLRLYVHEVGQ